MTYTRLPRAARAARIGSCVALFFSAMELLLLSDFHLADAPKSGTGITTLYLAMLLPPLTMLLLARSVTNGSARAFFGVLAAAAVVPICALFIGMPSKSEYLERLSCSIFTWAPYVYILVVCGYIVPDARMILRRQRHEAPRGFQPIMPATPLIEPLPVLPLGPAEAIQSKRQVLLTHHMEQTIKSAWLVAGVLLVAGGFVFVMNPAGNRYTMDDYVGAILIYYMLPAVLLMLLAWRMERRELWAYFAALLIAVLQIARTLLEMALAWGARMEVFHRSYYVAAWARFPCMLFIIACINAIPDVIDVRRQRKRDASLDRQRRGQSVLPNPPPMAAVVPPPPPGRRSLNPSKGEKLKR